ncbi:MAG: AI-2E family transporter [Planctomycetes bacterium]|nr:AI-2E family transporter [Planctomycetota bacterium]
MPTSRLVTLAAIVVVVAALSLAQTVLMPVAMAIFLSFVLSPLVARLERWHLGRAPSVLIVALLAFGVLGSVGWIVGGQAVDIVTKLPDSRANLAAKLELLHEKLRAPLQLASDALAQLEHADWRPAAAPAGAAPAGAAPATTPSDAPADAPATVASSAPAADSLAARVLGITAGGLGSLFSVVATGAIVALLVVLMLIQRGDLRDRFIALSGGSVVVTTQALDEAAKRLSRYLLAQTAINAAHGAAIGIGLQLIGVPNSLLWAILAAVLRFVPYVGPWIAASIPILFSLAVSDGFTVPLLVIALFVAFELSTNLVVEPLVLPNRIGVSTTALVVSVIFWTWLWGTPGLVLAVPLTVCVAVMGNHIPSMRFLSTLLGDDSVVSASVRLYQRLIVGDVEDAFGLATAERKGGKSSLEVHDALLLPALCLAQRDRLDLVIDEPTLLEVVKRARDLSEELSERRDPTQPARVRSDPLRVVCVAAGKEADGAVAAMLCAVLRRAGFDASEAPPSALVGEALAAIATAHADAICVSQLPPLSFSRLRYVCKRVEERFPGRPILVGTWTMSLDLARVHERLESSAALQVAGSFAEMVEQLERLADAPRA